MGLFSSIPDRENGQRIVRGWFNDLKQAGIDLAAGLIGTATFTIANNQSAAANVTNAVLSSSSFTSWQIHAEIKRGSVVCIFKITAYYDGTNWNLDYQEIGGDTGITFTIDASTGQLKYQSTNTSAGTMKWAFQNKCAA